MGYKIVHINFFDKILLIILVLLWPISAVTWFQKCWQEQNKIDASLFLAYGSWGLIGISLLVSMWFVPFPTNGLMALLAYDGCAIRFVDLASTRLYRHYQPLLKAYG